MQPEDEDDATAKLKLPAGVLKVIEEEVDKLKMPSKTMNQIVDGGRPDSVKVVIQLLTV